MKTNVDGKFMRVSDYDKHGPVVVIMVGNLSKDTIGEEGIEFIKTFYNRSGWKHRFVDKFPDGFARRPHVACDSMANGFMVIEQ